MFQSIVLIKWLNLIYLSFRFKIVYYSKKKSIFVFVLNLRNQNISIISRIKY